MQDPRNNDRWGTEPSSRGQTDAEDLICPCQDPSQVLRYVLPGYTHPKYARVEEQARGTFDALRASFRWIIRELCGLRSQLSRFTCFRSSATQEFRLEDGARESALRLAERKRSNKCEETARGFSSPCAGRIALIYRIMYRILLSPW